MDNLTAKCIICHAEKSEKERLGAVYRKHLYSELSRDVLEGLHDAPKPQQIVFGDGTEDCAMIDAIRCRPNALLKNQMPLPVASIVDTMKQFDLDNWHSDDIKKGRLYLH